MLRSIKFLLPALLIMMSCTAYAAPGDLDTSFNPSNGFATYDSGNADYGRAVILQTDGKILVSGRIVEDSLVVRFIGDAGGEASPLAVGSSGGGCFIATAAYGSRMANEVKMLQRVRDEYLLPSELGKAFVSAHYRSSPSLAGWIAKRPTRRRIVRVGLYPILELSRCLVGENPSQ